MLSINCRYRTEARSGGRLAKLVDAVVGRWMPNAFPDRSIPEAQMKKHASAQWQRLPEQILLSYGWLKLPSGPPETLRGASVLMRPFRIKRPMFKASSTNPPDDHSKTRSRNG